MSEYTAETDFGALRIRRVDRTETILGAVRVHSFRTVYAVSSRGIEGCLAVDPSFNDAQCGDIFLGPERRFATHPTEFSVRCGRSGSLSARNDGTVPKTDPVLLVDGAEVLSPLTSLPRGCRTDFEVSLRAGAWASSPAPALVAAKTLQVVHAVLALHEEDTSHVDRMDVLYTQHRAADRRKAAMNDLRHAERMASDLDGRIQRLRAYLDVGATVSTSR
ncbi:hypothetical protein [Streptomyces californicus]|uniref:hypothetical protein n=1 Tax=Streptomyces californicus TaxID=67351 RepID=UPI00296E9B94|nr:hypothetical protein [Streptomyces californicus]MDW4912573.1 hypothetical protein [Streptomyces californicus]